MSDNKNPEWLDERSSQVDSWWGAVAALMFAQAYSFILLQGLIHFTVFEPVAVVFFLILSFCQASVLKIMSQYLKAHSWKTALRFTYSPVETLKFLAAIVATAAYVYLLTGHRPIPRDPTLYKDIGILGNLAFQLFNLAISSALTPISKATAALQAMRPATANAPVSTSNSVIGLFGAMGMGAAFIAISCYSEQYFYVFGVIGYGVIMLMLTKALTSDPRAWVAKS
jgi:hypothetical protein